MSMDILRYIALGLTAAVVAGCQMGGVNSSAPIVDKRPASGKPGDAARSKITVTKGQVVVQRGDTLYRIAQEVGQSVSDLVAWNGLANPNDIKVDQVLRVTPPEPGSTPQTGSVASSSEVEARPAGSQAPADRADSAAKGGGGADGGRMVIEGMSWVWPTEGNIIQPYTAARKGIALGGKMGQPVVAAGAGTVLYAGSVRGYGNLVIVKHTNTLLSAYAHNRAILVKEGQNVTQGQRIAEMGNTDTDQVKLHFEIRQQGKPVDPTKFLPAR